MNGAFKKKKQYGQNFLTNAAIPRRIAEESGITKDDCVIEIGPGFGILTRELCERAKKVVAVEIDGELIGILNEKFAETPNFKLINADILKTDIKRLIKDEFGESEVCVCANLPYYITSEIVMSLLEGRYGFKSITVMVQKEVAERFTSKPGEDGYGAITAAINYYSDCKRLFIVKAGSFDPKPKVDSAVIKFTLYKTPPVQVSDEKLFFTFIKAAFSQRRKTLVNALYSAFSDIRSKEDLTSLLQSLGYSPNVRGEELSINDFAAIANRFQLNN